jgi:O-antigen/teichoic acid export membrane protein
MTERIARQSPARIVSMRGSQLIRSGRERRNRIAVIAGALVNVILNVLLLPLYGAVAAALTTALAQGTVAALNFYFVRDLPRPALRGPIAIALVTTVFMGELIVWLQRVSSIHVLLMILIGTAAYGFLYFLLWRMRNQVVARPRTTESR